MYRFKAGDKIHVNYGYECDKLMEMLDEQGYKWNGGESINIPATNIIQNFTNLIIYILDDKKITYGSTFLKNELDECLDFYDIIEPAEPELTAAEAIQAQAEMCDSTPCSKCKLNRGKQDCISYRRKHPDEAVKVIEEYLYKKTLRKDFELAAAELRAKAEERN